MKLFLKIVKMPCILMQVLLLTFSPLFVLAADPVVGARLMTPADRKEGYVAYMKTQGPQVKVTFDNQSARTGDIITAQATPSGFKDNPEDLYYTWYIRREGCELDSTKEGCDKDGDGKVTENDWKIEAARILAKNGFDSEKDANYSGSGDSDGDGYEADPDTGEWKMPYKDENEVDDVENCYIQDFDKGRFYELRETEPIFSCSNGGTMSCGKTEQITCSDGPKSVCSASNDYECKVEKDEDVENFIANVECPTDSNLSSSQQKSPVCGEQNKTLFSNASSNSANICKTLEDDPNAGGICSGTMVFNSDNERIGSSPSCTFKKSNNLCKHLFPTQIAPKNLRGDSIKTGDGEFTVEEERFWGTDPANKSTAGNGKSDEENIMGLGANSFSWTYRAGDEIGLVVEGVGAVATKHDDNSYMRTWAFSKNVCKELSDNIKKDRAFYVEYQKVPGINAGFLTVEFDLNDCLEENLIDPTGGGVGTLNVNVLATPSIAKNDSSKSGSGDIIRAQATVSGADDMNSLHYDWTVEASSDGTKAPVDDKWIDITNKLGKHSATEGFGLNNFELTAEFADDIFVGSNDNVQYIRIKAKVAENSSDQNRIGRGVTVIQLTKTGAGMNAYLVGADSEGKISLNKNKVMCNEGVEISKCPVLENGIVGVSIPNENGNLANFSWKLNKESVSCNEQYSSDCGKNGGNVMFFPAAGVIGDTFELEASFIDNSTKMAQTVSRKFVIVQPSMKIASVDEELVWPKQLGIYKDINGDEIVDESSIVFETNQSNTVALETEFTPSWIGNYARYSWKVNGEFQAENEDLEFSVEQAPGATYNISAEATYAMASDEEENANVRKALADIWGISAQDTTEKYLESSVQIEVVNSSDEIAKAKGGIMASIIGNIPSETLFLLRLMLTAMVMVVVTGIIFSLTPNVEKKIS